MQWEYLLAYDRLWHLEFEVDLEKTNLSCCTNAMESAAGYKNLAAKVHGAIFLRGRNEPNGECCMLCHSCHSMKIATWPLKATTPLSETTRVDPDPHWSQLGWYNLQMFNFRLGPPRECDCKMLWQSENFPKLKRLGIYQALVKKLCQSNPSKPIHARHFFHNESVHVVLSAEPAVRFLGGTSLRVCHFFGSGCSQHLTLKLLSHLSLNLPKFQTQNSPQPLHAQGASQH